MHFDNVADGTIYFYPVGEGRINVFKIKMRDDDETSVDSVWMRDYKNDKEPHDIVSFVIDTLCSKKKECKKPKECKKTQRGVYLESVF